MFVSLRCYWEVKSGNSPEEYEDAASPNEALFRNMEEPLRCAVADGATETSFSRQWAKVLVDAYATGKLDASNIVEVLPSLQGTWEEAVSRKPLPWYAAEKRSLGAFSSLVGLTLFPESEGSRWVAVAVGDSCLFQIRRRCLLRSFPISESLSFNYRPMLVPSLPSRSSGLSEYVVIENRTWEHDDVFLVMTDALACWFLKEVESVQGNWVNLLDFGDAPPGAFSGWIASLRAEGELRNDDVTLLRIDVGGGQTQCLGRLSKTTTKRFKTHKPI